MKRDRREGERGMRELLHRERITDSASSLGAKTSAWL